MILLQLTDCFLDHALRRPVLVKLLLRKHLCWRYWFTNCCFN